MLFSDVLILFKFCSHYGWINNFIGELLRIGGEDRLKAAVH